MADIVKVRSEELQECAARYLRSLGTMRECVSEYQNALEALSNDWTGRAFIIMSGKVAAMVAKIIASFDRINDAVSELGEVKALLEETESTLKSQAEALDVGTQSEFQG